MWSKLRFKLHNFTLILKLLILNLNIFKKVLRFLRCNGRSSIDNDLYYADVPFKK